ncbi:MAG TPA: prepilin-type N-terminal cleavage/methylation domain-containing protein [Opitutaceae bacterium]|nr:prepilin-type N-terminal cleavage/methylation domain-containing protein [Opitutaceae bacterium]
MKQPTATKPRSVRAQAAAGFTLVELLTVLAILGILAAILVPVVGRAQESARRSKVKTQFAQWAAALEGFRAEYGYYPNFAAGSASPAPAACRINDVPGLFFQTLTGRNETGGAPDLARAATANPRRIAFVTFSAAELGAGSLPPICDEFGNTDIVLLVDQDGDGLIPAPAAPLAVLSAQTGRTLMPSEDAFPSGGIRANVAFYSAGAGRDSDSIVYSWR